MRKVMLVTAIVMIMIVVPMSAFATFSGQKFCIDPGHGGSDPGAVALGDQEKVFNLDIGLRTRTVFQQDGNCTIVMTRTSDVAVSLQGRCDISNNNGCNRFVSTHCNAGGGYGTEVYCYALGGSGANLAGYTLNHIVAHLATTNRGVKTAGFYVLVNTVAPAILGEVAFIDTVSDNNILSDANKRQLAALGYLHGMQQHYGIAAHNP